MAVTGAGAAVAIARAVAREEAVVLVKVILVVVMAAVVAIVAVVMVAVVGILRSLPLAHCSTRPLTTAFTPFAPVPAPAPPPTRCFAMSDQQPQEGQQQREHWQLMSQDGTEQSVLKGKLCTVFYVLHFLCFTSLCILRVVCISDVCFAYFRFERCCVLLLLVGVLCMFHACVCNCFVCLVAWFMYLYTLCMLFVCFALP